MQFSRMESAINKWKFPQTWLLVQILSLDETSQINSSFSGQYLILLPMDLLESDTTNTHAEGYVRFLHNQRLMEGRVIFSSPNRSIVEEKLQKLTTPAITFQPIAPKKPKYFLVQFSKGNKDVIQAVVPEKDVTWPTSIHTNQREVLIFDGNQKRVANILHASENKEQIVTEFQKLKIYCFEKAFDDQDYDNSIADNNWMLVFYTCGPTNAVYTILHNRDTYWQRGNRYKDAVAYITDGRNVYQSIIIRKSHSYDELLHYLNFIKNGSLVANFPLNVDLDSANALPPPKFQSLCGTIETFERLAGNRQYTDLERTLKELEDRMRDEAATLVECMEVLDHAKQTLEQREIILRDF